MSTSLSDILNPEFLQQVMAQYQQAQPPSQAPAPQQNPYGVPVVYTEPDVVVRGRLELEFIFKHADIVNQTPDQVQQLAMMAVMGQSGPGIPLAKVGHLQLWREVPAPPQPPQQGVIDDIARNRIIAEFLRNLGGSTPDPARVPGFSPPGYIGSDGDSQSGIPDPATEWGRSSGGELVRHSVSGAGDAPGEGQNLGTGTRPPVTKYRPSRRRREATDQPQFPESELDVIREGE